MRDILVFLKQVAAGSKVKIDPQTNTLIRKSAGVQTNPDDLHALQMAVNLKKQMGGGTITAVSMGPLRAEITLREAIMFGADKAILVTDKHFGGSDTYCTSSVLAATVLKISPNAILFFGKQTIDGDTAQVGPGVAAHLNIPQLTEVIKINEFNADQIIVEKRCNNGTQIIQSTLPCVITVSKNTCKLPVPTLNMWLKSQETEIAHLGIVDLELDTQQVGLKGSPTKVIKTEVPKIEKQPTVWLNNVDDLATSLLSILK
jgi:electron transfer flavoprotein beta subunit